MFHDDTTKLPLGQIPLGTAMQFFNERYHDYLTLVSLDKDNEIANEARFIVQLMALKRGCRR